MLRFSYETLTNSWFYGEWIVKIIAKVMILIIHFVLHKKRRETMKDDKKEKSEQRYMERIRLIKDRVGEGILLHYYLCCTGEKCYGDDEVILTGIIHMHKCQSITVYRNADFC